MKLAQNPGGLLLPHILANSVSEIYSGDPQLEERSGLESPAQAEEVYFVAERGPGLYVQGTNLY